MKFAVASWMLLLVVLPMFGQTPARCKGNPIVIGDCFKVHGRLSAYNGTPSLRIWRIGTKRLLGVHEGYDQNGAEVYWVPKSIYEKVDFGIFIFADFELCPITKERPGEMQIVCEESASNVVIKDLREKAQSKRR